MKNKSYKENDFTRSNVQEGSPYSESFGIVPTRVFHFYDCAHRLESILTFDMIIDEYDGEYIEIVYL